MGNLSLRATNLFRDRPLVIATMHGKEVVIAPLLERQIKVKCQTIQGFDTDQYGTFSGEIKRLDTALNTTRIKAMAALAHTGGTLAVASEGSFGSHPSCFWVPANEEFVCLVDIENDLFITGWHFTEKTNFASRCISSLEELEEFCIQTGYPEHGLLLHYPSEINKVIALSANWEVLRKQALQWLEKGYSPKVETDMRAMHNPTRMMAIESAVRDLIQNIYSLCPNCNCPGFSIIGVVRGLPCKLCLRQTRAIKAHKYGCAKCQFEEMRNKNGPAFEDPMYCDYCNP